MPPMPPGRGNPAMAGLAAARPEAPDADEGQEQGAAALLQKAIQLLSSGQPIDPQAAQELAALLTQVLSAISENKGGMPPGMMEG